MFSISRKSALVSIFVAGVLAACSKPKPPAPAVEEPAPVTTAAPVPTAAPEAPTPAPAPVATLDLQTVYFDFDSYALNSTAQEQLRKVAEGLKSNASTKIQIEGHADERGSNEYNLALGERRARAAQEFLVSEGVTSTNLSTISYGEERPATQGTSEDAWTKNRRTEFKQL